MQHTVTAADEDIRLDRWFKRHMPGVTHGLLEKSLRKGLVKLDGKKAKASQRVAAGQVIDVRIQVSGVRKDAGLTPDTRHMAPDDARTVQNMVLYKDDDIIVINKPPGLAVQGGTKQEKHLDGMLDGLRYDAPVRPKLVHRLDKDTSGCLVLARSAKAAAELSRKFASRKTEKMYVALVMGLPMPLAGSIHLPLAKMERGKDSRMDTYEQVQVDEKSGQKAHTEYRVLEHCGSALSMVELKPITGRTHQLRVHMAAKGHPIIGDGKYGGTEAFVRGSLKISNQLHLHAMRLVIPDVFGKTIDVTAPLPRHMQESLNNLGLSDPYE